MNQTQREPRQVGIGDLVLDRDTRELRRGGDLIALTRLSYRLFDCLVNAAPAVVSHDDLVEQVWDGRVASPETVTQRIKLLRDALGDDARQPRYVALVRGQGYRLVPDVVPLQADGTEAPQGPARFGMRQVIAVSAIVAAATAGLYYAIVPALLDDPVPPVPIIGEPPSNSVAVLPFVGTGPADNVDYLREGLGDTLRDQLGRMGGLQVAARSSSVAFRGTASDAVTIARRLGVRNLVEGSMQTDGDRITISLSIVDGESGFQWWSNVYESDAAGLPATQATIARQVMEQLSPDSGFSIADAQPASLDPTANQLMQRARHIFQQVRDEPIVDIQLLGQSIDLYRRAIETDPDSALANVRLARALLYQGDIDAARAPIAAARSINPDLAEVQYTLGLYRWMTYEPGSGVAYQRAIELDPHHPDAQEAYGKWIWHQLVSDEPEAHFLRALQSDSASLTRYADLGTYYGMSGQRDKALEIARQIPMLFADATAYMAVSRTLELTGDIDAAIGWALRAHALEPDRPDTGWMVAELYARIDEFAKAHDYEPGPSFNLLYWERRYDELIDLGQELVIEQPQQPQLWFGLAFALTATGDHELAIRYLGEQRIPERVFSENRRANQNEALVILADALKEGGKAPQAMELAAWFRPYLENMIDTGGDSAWWPHLYLACVDSILDRDAAALDSLERMERAWGMPWYPLLVDAPCMRRFEGEPRYEAVVAAIDRRKQRIRDRLPATLERLRAEWTATQ